MNFDIQEASILAEDARIAALGASLRNTRKECAELESQLSQFDKKIRVCLEPLVLPLQRSLGTISRVNTNVEATLKQVRKLAEWHELARKHEEWLQKIQLINLQSTSDYIERIKCLKAALNDLESAGLSDLCTVTSSRIKKIYSETLKFLIESYQEWLESFSVGSQDFLNVFAPSDPTSIGSEPSSIEEQMSYLKIETDSYKSTQQDKMQRESLVSKILAVTHFALGDPDLAKAVVTNYGVVRAKFIMRALHPFFIFSNSSNEVPSIPNAFVAGGGYRRGSHPLIAAIHFFYRLVYEEARISARLLPENLSIDGLTRSLKHPADVLKMSVEAVCSVVSKSILQCGVKGELQFTDEIWILDVLEVFNDVFTNILAVTDDVSDNVSNDEFHKNRPSESDISQNTHYKLGNVSIRDYIKIIDNQTRSALKSVTMCAVSLVKSLLDEVGTGDAKMITKSPPNATVSPLASSVLGCLRKMLDYTRVLEVLLNKWADKTWDGFLGTLPGKSMYSVAKLQQSVDAANDKSRENSDLKENPNKEIKRDSEDTILFATALYYQDILRGVEAVVDEQSKFFPRTITATLFQLNNANHILKIMRTTEKLTAILPIGVGEKRYEGLVESLVEAYLAHWVKITTILNVFPSEDENKKDRVPINDQQSMPRDRIRAFTNNLEECVKDQATCAVPDRELRGRLVEGIREAVLPVYEKFCTNILGIVTNETSLTSSLGLERQPVSINQKLRYDVAQLSQLLSSETLFQG